MLRRCGFTCEMPGGTYFLYAPAPKGTGDGRTFANAEEASQYLIHEHSIVTVPWDDAGPVPALLGHLRGGRRARGGRAHGRGRGTAQGHSPGLLRRAASADAPRRSSSWRLLAALRRTAARPGARAAQVERFVPQGTARQVRQASARFSSPMVALGDPRVAAPFDVACPAPGSRAVDRPADVGLRLRPDLPAGVVCTFTAAARACGARRRRAGRGAALRVLHRRPGDRPRHPRRRRRDRRGPGAGAPARRPGRRRVDRGARLVHRPGRSRSASRSPC